MQNLIKIDEKALSEILNEWFELNKEKKLLDKNFWARNKVGRQIKDKLTNVGKWRNKARGNPKKGYQEFLKKQNDW